MSASTGTDAARRYGAEFIGTALLVIGGVGTAVLAPKAGPVGIALAFGLTLLVLAYAIGPISGAHVNPAVTIGMTLARRLSPVDAVGYIVAQVAGALAGAGVVYAIASNRKGYSLSTDGLGSNGWGSLSTGGYTFTAAAIAEVVLTAVLVFTVINVTAPTANAAVAGVPIGLALAVIHLVAVPIDGTSVNPARSLGPALIQGGDALGQVWLFIIAPIIGAVIAAVLAGVLALRGTETRVAHRDSTANPSRPLPTG